MKHLLMSCLSLAFVACGSPSAEDPHTAESADAATRDDPFDQSCTTATDCVIERRIASDCCDRIAINVADHDRYDAARRAAPVSVCSALCTQAHAICDAGQCAVRLGAE